MNTCCQVNIYIYLKRNYFNQKQNDTHNEFPTYRSKTCLKIWIQKAKINQLQPSSVIIKFASNEDFKQTYDSQPVEICIHKSTVCQCLSCVLILDISNNFQTREIINFNQGKGAVQQLPWSHATSSHQTTTFSFGCKQLKWQTVHVFCEGRNGTLILWWMKAEFIDYTLSQSGVTRCYKTVLLQ